MLPCLHGLRNNVSHTYHKALTRRFRRGWAARNGVLLVSQSNSAKWLLDQLTRRFKPAFWIRPGTALSICGLTNASNPRAAAYQMISRRNYPFVLRSIKGHKMVLLVDVVNAIEAARVVKSNPDSPRKAKHLAKQLATARETLERTLTVPKKVVSTAISHSMPATGFQPGASPS